MSAIEFIGFVIVMVASVMLSFKRNREKKASLDIFEQFEEKPRKVSNRRLEFEEDDEIEDWDIAEEQKEQELKRLEEKKALEQKKKVIEKKLKKEKKITTEKKEFEKKYVVADVEPAHTPIPLAVTPQKDFLKKDKAFDFHTDTLAKNKTDTKVLLPLLNAKSLKNSVIMQEILNKPKGW
jgi:hypothetical protein